MQSLWRSSSCSAGRHMSSWQNSSPTRYRPSGSGWSSSSATRPRSSPGLPMNRRASRPRSRSRNSCGSKRGGDEIRAGDHREGAHVAPVRTQAAQQGLAAPLRAEGAQEQQPAGRAGRSRPQPHPDGQHEPERHVGRPDRECRADPGGDQHHRLPGGGEEPPLGDRQHLVAGALARVLARGPPQMREPGETEDEGGQHGERRTHVGRGAELHRDTAPSTATAAGLRRSPGPGPRGTVRPPGRAGC